MNSFSLQSNLKRYFEESEQFVVDFVLVRCALNDLRNERCRIPDQNDLVVIAFRSRQQSAASGET